MDNLCALSLLVALLVVSISADTDLNLSDDKIKQQVFRIFQSSTKLTAEQTLDKLKELKHLCENADQEQHKELVPDLNKLIDLAFINDEICYNIEKLQKLDSEDKIISIVQGRFNVEEFVDHYLAAQLEHCRQLFTTKIQQFDYHLDAEKKRLLKELTERWIRSNKPGVFDSADKKKKKAQPTDVEVETGMVTSLGRATAEMISVHLPDLDIPEANPVQAEGEKKPKEIYAQHLRTLLGDTCSSIKENIQPALLFFSSLTSQPDPEEAASILPEVYLDWVTYTGLCISLLVKEERCVSTSFAYWKDIKKGLNKVEPVILEEDVVADQKKSFWQTIMDLAFMRAKTQEGKS